MLGGVKAAGQGEYTYLDKNPIVGQNFYRLKQEGINNVMTCSKAVPILYSEQSDLPADKLNIYPNPASSMINLAIASETNDAVAYKMTLTNSTGTVVKEFTSSQNALQTNVSNLLPGTYLVRVIDNKTQSLVAENKFVKL
ncbi:T9SS type A sorting domain-containing protein [Mucilaginibacter sp. McL0603]|uniref:T9SS type A sorting domain-containing protein n=1 Tax=Mucilaginibacter sp. McL0603 TaxID=3415670 RepID=UPI003CF58DC7